MLLSLNPELVSSQLSSHKEEYCYAKPEGPTQHTSTKSTRGNLPTSQGCKTRIPREFFLGTRSQAAQKTARAHSRQDDDDDRREGREGPASDSFYSYSVTLQ